MDISADLDELARTPLVVVCAGPKSILDVGRTLEVLETRGVPVVLPVGPATYVDGNAVIAWSAGAQAVTTTSLRLRRSGYARQTQEAVNLQFRGAPGNFVVVQPFEV